jgi:hypothetical protein
MEVDHTNRVIARIPGVELLPFGGVLDAFDAGRIRYRRGYSIRA